MLLFLFRPRTSYVNPWTARVFVLHVGKHWIRAFIVKEFSVDDIAVEFYSASFCLCFHPFSFMALSGQFCTKNTATRLHFNQLWYALQIPRYHETGSIFRRSHFVRAHFWMRVNFSLAFGVLCFAIDWVLFENPSYNIFAFAQRDIVCSRFISYPLISLQAINKLNPKVNNPT